MFTGLKLYPALFIGFFTATSFFISNLSFFKNLAISPLIIGISVGIIIGNTTGHRFPIDWSPTITFFTKAILRLGIIFYGFRVSFQDIAEIGILGILLAIFVVFSTFFLGFFFGKKVFGLDKETSILVSSGASVCGAAAVLATESTIKSKSEKSSLAIATVVIFGTISMFLYPFLFQSGILTLPPDKIGIFLGSSIHEVAQVVASGNVFSSQTADTALIVKMTRVIFLVPFLIMLGVLFTTNMTGNTHKNLNFKNIWQKSLQALPLFAIYFLMVISINSLFTIPVDILNITHQIDQILLTMAMFALGMETNVNRLKNSGGKAFGLAFVLFLWLGISTYLLLKFGL